MVTLSKDWLTDGIFDFEYKKYVLLAYLQQTDKRFTDNLIAPHLQELEAHFRSSLALRSQKQLLRSAFPKELKSIDTRQWKPVYEEQVPEDHFLAELNYILDFAIPRLSASVSNGTEKFSEIEGNIKVSPIGIVPLRIDEGYLLFVGNVRRMVSVYRYQLALFNERQERYLNTSFIEDVRISPSRQVDQIKVELVKKYKAWPNPAAYVVESRYDYPLQETLLPVAKHLMIRQLRFV